MKRGHLGLIGGAIIVISTGCASSTGSLQRASATYIGRDTSPESVQISNVQRGALDVRWTATAPNGAIYACSADDMLRQATCARH